MVSVDLSRIANLNKIQFVVRPIRKKVERATLMKNPLKNLNVMLRLNPYANIAKRMTLLAEAKCLW